MRRLITLILALAILFPSLASAYEILVLQSRRDPASEEVLKGFRSSCPVSHRTLVLSDYAEVDLIRIVREENPRLILTLGDTALKATRRINRTPVLALMALGIRQQALHQPNLAGIDMFAPPEQYLELFKSLKTRRVGVVYSQGKSGWYLRQARQAAERAGITLVTREVSAPAETLAQLSSLSGKVDALWMLPDTTAVTRETSEAYFRFGLNEAVPVVSFSGSYLGLGAGAVVEINRVDLGRQACQMATSIIKGDAPAAPPIQLPLGVSIKTNPDILRRLTSAISLSRLLSML